LTYFDGQTVRIGDEVRLADGQWRGIVVGSIGEGEFFGDVRAEDWAYLGKGALVDYKEVGLVHHDIIEQDVELVRRTALAR
jgi:hypothetical protein